MPFGVRDVLLVIRAKDQASSVIRGVGSGLGSLGNTSMTLSQQMTGVGVGLLSMGAGMVAIGGAATAFFATSIKSAIDFDTQSRSTLTQVNQFKASLQQVEQVALDVATTLPVPFEQLQPALFDIFSSIPVANMEDAKNILIEMSKAAVAGNTDVQTVARSNFEIMNAYGLSVQDLNHLLDVQFKLVQLGIGTYADINTGIGRLAPTAKTAGQSIDTMAGSLAFMTRITGNGEQAITAIQRAMESITNPKVAAKFQDLGIAVADANGNFRPFKDIVDDLSKALSNMDPQDRAATIFDLFRSSGSGSKNTRQFFMAAIDNIGAFNDAIDGVANNAGALQDAFQTMADGPEASLRQLSNDFKAIKLLIGQALLPVVEQLTGWIQTLVAWWMKLDPELQHFIIIGGAIAAVVTLISGIFLTLAGTFLLVLGILIPIVGGFGAALAVMVAIPLVIAALVAGLIWLAANWDVASAAVSKFVDDAKVYLADLAQTFTDAWHNIQEPVHRTLHNIQALFKNVFGDLRKWWDQNGGAMLKEIGDAFGDAWKNIKATVQPAMEAIVNIINFAVTIIQALWDSCGTAIMYIVETAFRFIVEIIKNAVEVITGIVQFVADLINGDWAKAWEAAKMIVDGIFDAIMETLRAAVGLISGAIMLIVDVILTPFRWLYDVLIGNSIIPDLINGIVDWFARLPGMLFGVLWDAVNWLAGVGADIVTGLWNGMWSMIGWLVGQVASIKDWIVGAFGDTLNFLHDVAVNVVVGLWQGLESMKDWLIGKVESLASSAWDAFTGFFGISSPSKKMHWAGQMMMQGLANGLTAGSDIPQMALNNLDLSLNTINGASGGSSVPFSNPAGGVGNTYNVSFVINDATDPEKVGKVVLSHFDELMREMDRR